MSSDDADESKLEPDIFEIVLKNLNIEDGDALAIGDIPYDAEAAQKTKIATIGVALPRIHKPSAEAAFFDSILGLRV